MSFFPSSPGDSSLIEPSIIDESIASTENNISFSEDNSRISQENKYNSLNF